MKSNKNYYISVFFVAIFAFSISCKKDNTTANTNALYTPAATDVTANATLQELQLGRELYVNNCGKCHSLYSPDAYTPAKWKNIMPGMASKTSLSSSDVLLVTKYVTRGKQ